MFSFSSYTIFVVFPKADLSWLLKFVSARFQGRWGYQAFTFSREARSWAEGLQSPPMVNAEGSMQEKGSSSVVRSLFPDRHLGCSLGLAGSRGVTPGDNHLWLLCSSHELTSGACSASGISWAEICKYWTDSTQREETCPCQQKSSQAWAFWRRKHCSLVSFRAQGICPDPGGACDPSPGHQNLGTVLWPRLNHHSWLCSCILMLCTYCHILGYISYSELKLLSINDQLLLIWKGWTLNSCCLTSWNINIRLERCPWLVALNVRKCIHRTILLFQDHLWQCCPVKMS